MELFGANAVKRAEEMLRKRMTADDYDNPLANSATLRDIRGSEFLDTFFRDLFAEFKIYNPMPKREFSRVAEYMDPSEIHPEVIGILDEIARILAR